MTWLAAACGLVALLQGVAWLAHAAGPRRVGGVVLAVAGIVMLCGGLVHGLVPAFLGQ